MCTENKVPKKEKKVPTANIKIHTYILYIVLYIIYYILYILFEGHTKGHLLEKRSLGVSARCFSTLGFVFGLFCVVFRGYSWCNILRLILGMLKEELGVPISRVCATTSLREREREQKEGEEKREGRRKRGRSTERGREIGKRRDDSLITRMHPRWTIAQACKY